MFSIEGGQAAGDAAARARRDRDHLRQRPARARRDPGRPPGRADGPDGFSVVGFDDSAFMSCTDPPLTTVRQPIEAMGRAAVTMLVSQIEGGDGLDRGALLRARARRSRLDRACGRVARGSPWPPRSATARQHCIAAMQDLANCTILQLHLSECVMLAAVSRCLDVERHPLDGARAVARPATAWWRDAVIYQVYVAQLRRRERRRRSATWPESAPGCRTCATSASTRSGSTPGTRRRWPTTATTSRTTDRSTPPSARSLRPRS